MERKAMNAHRDWAEFAFLDEAFVCSWPLPTVIEVTYCKVDKKRPLRIN